MMKKTKMLRRQKNHEYMTVRDHIHELKSRVIISFVVFFIFFILFYIRSDIVFAKILQIGSDCGYAFSYISPYETIIQVIRCCVVCAFFASLPVIVYEIVSYIMPAFDTNAKKPVIRCTILAFLLFCIGVAFCIKILLPFVYTYMYNYSLIYGLTSNVSIEKYVSSFIQIIIILGVIFELPLICACFGRLGILSHEHMLTAIRPVTVVILIISAIITPPDVFSMILVAIPMFLVYLCSVYICKLSQKHR